MEYFDGFPISGCRRKTILKNRRKVSDFFKFFYRVLPPIACDKIFLKKSGLNSFASPDFPVIWNITFISVRASVKWVLHTLYFEALKFK